MAYWQLYYHIVWATKDRRPLITKENESHIYGFIREKAQSLGGTVFAINGMFEHTHVATTIPPRIAAADFVGQLKGFSSISYNRRKETGADELAWQSEYGNFSFDRKPLPNVIAYIENQKLHHQQQHSLIPILERWEENKQAVIRESSSHYFVEERSLREEMLELSTELLEKQF